MRRPSPQTSSAEAALLGLLHGPAELLPVSSSAHMAIIGVEVDQSLAVALHAGTALALLDRASRDPVLLLGAGAVSLGGALLLGEAAERRLASPRAIAAGMLAGSAAMVAADRGPQTRSSPGGWGDALALGAAQVAALWPGVSRNGATLAAGRLRGLDRRAADRASFGVGVPTMIGAAAFSARRQAAQRVHAVAAASALASTLVARAVVRRSGPLWPLAAYRTGVALLLLGTSRR